MKAVIHVQSQDSKKWCFKKKHIILQKSQWNQKSWKYCNLFSTVLLGHSRW